MKHKPTILVFFVIILTSCYTDPVNDVTKKVEVTTMNQRKHWNDFDTQEEFRCIANYECRSINGCNFNDEKNLTLLKSHYQWDQDIPRTAKFEMDNNGFTIHFSWDKKNMKNADQNTVFQSNQVWIVKIVMENADFSLHQNKQNTHADFVTNIPCPFRYYPYAKNNTRTDYIEMLKATCEFTEEEILDNNLYELKLISEKFITDQSTILAIGSTCPEKFITDTTYFITYKTKTGDKKNTMVSIRSTLTEIGFNLQSIKYNESLYEKSKKCPYLIGPIDITTQYGRSICGRINEKKWIDRVCVPTKRFLFTPGIDTENKKHRRSYCFDDIDNNYDLGDGDGWFDRRTHTYDVGGNIVPITNNMLLHGTHIGDCADNDYNTDYHTENCNWFNVGHIAPGKQCFWKNIENDVACYFNEKLTIRHYPQQFLDRFHIESKKNNSYAGSFDRIGLPANWVYKVKDGLIQIYSHGSIGVGAIMLNFKKPEKAFYVGWPFWEIYSHRFNNGNGILGYPIEESIYTNTYHEQKFEYGWIRKYHKGSCWLVQKENNMPETYCFSCSTDSDCKEKNTACIKNICEQLKK